MLVDGPVEADHLLVLAHGSGQAVDDPLLSRLAAALGAQGISVVRFEFDFMAARRTTGAPHPVDPDAQLRQRFTEVATTNRRPHQALVLGGFSLGARIASQLAESSASQLAESSASQLAENSASQRLEGGDVAGLVCVSFPFHPKGQPAERHAAEQLRRVRMPTLVVQGSRDAFGNREQVRGYHLPGHIQLAFLDDANHNLKPRQGGAAAHHASIDRAAALIGRFVKETCGPNRSPG